MFSISAPTEKLKYSLAELAKMFVSADELCFTDRETQNAEGPFDIYIESDTDKNKCKRVLYDFLSNRTGKTLDWGILTGVRPGKLYNTLVDANGQQEAEHMLKTDYYVSDEKLELLRGVRQTQADVNGDESPRAVGIYAGIPFCPTRCLYCSFTSNRFTEDGSKRYLSEGLYKEIDALADMMAKKGLYAESLYIGGGTPTSLLPSDFKQLLNRMRSAFSSPETREFTVESGRPDTITAEKLSMIKACGAQRISINPQTMKAATLELIGREHRPEDIRMAFSLARAEGIEIINADLIAGLPGEVPEDFEQSLNEVLDLEPENITVHTLAVKKASRLIERDRDFAFKQAENVRDMLFRGQALLKQAGYVPYYLYRQKHMAGNFENVGYCKPGKASIYNIRIMEENQTILALGAGAISKLYKPDEKLVRIPNVSNYEIYIENIQEMIKRKEDGIL